MHVNDHNDVIVCLQVQDDGLVTTQQGWSRFGRDNHRYHLTWCVRDLVVRTAEPHEDL